MRRRLVFHAILLALPTSSTDLGDLVGEDLESLLHFAVRHSDHAKLREMAEIASADIPSFPNSLDDFMHTENDVVFHDVVNRTIVAKSWGTEPEFEAALDYISDYGDHHFDKGGMLEKFGALSHLLDWTVRFNSTGMNFTDFLLVRVADLLVGISQNREETHSLILSHRPGIVRELFHSFTNQWLCHSPVDERMDWLCASLVSAISAILGVNQSLVHHVDIDVLVPLAATFSHMPIETKLFARTLSLLRVAQSQTPGVPMEWKRELRVAALLNRAVETDEVFLGEQLVALLESIDDGMHASMLSKARTRIAHQCSLLKGNEHEWCISLQEAKEGHSEL